MQGHLDTVKLRLVHALSDLFLVKGFLFITAVTLRLGIAFFIFFTLLYLEVILGDSGGA